MLKIILFRESHLGLGSLNGFCGLAVSARWFDIEICARMRSGRSRPRDAPTRDFEEVLWDSSRERWESMWAHAPARSFVAVAQSGGRE